MLRRRALVYLASGGALLTLLLAAQMLRRHEYFQLMADTSRVRRLSSKIEKGEVLGRFSRSGSEVVCDGAVSFLIEDVSICTPHPHLKAWEIQTAAGFRLVVLGPLPAETGVNDFETFLRRLSVHRSSLIRVLMLSDKEYAEYVAAVRQKMSNSLNEESGEYFKTNSGNSIVRVSESEQSAECLFWADDGREQYSILVYGPDADVRRQIARTIARSIRRSSP